VIVDARGHRCPVPTLRLRRALETSDEVTLLADDPMAKIDVPHFARSIGAVVSAVEESGGTLRFVIQARQTPVIPDSAER
jgi:tRNA 2-thiouridine synthesizing protein A